MFGGSLILEINKIIGSDIRRRILGTLMRNRENSIMQLVRLVNSTHHEVNRNLSILEKESLIIQQLLGRKRLIRLNYDNDKTLTVIETLKYLNRVSLQLSGKNTTK
jgi:predicted transcriptional regulator